MKEEMWRQIENSFKFIHKNLDGYSISKKVDEIGIEAYINRCATLAATTGAVAGAGGGVTLLVGLPADMINTITQQFKVTLAVIYNETGRYKVSFKEFMKVVGLSVGIEMGVKGLEFLTVKIAKELLKRLASRTAGRIIPIIGGVIGGGVNFIFIKSIGGTLLNLSDSIFNS
jgi:hypothetical protein